MTEYSLHSDVKLYYSVLGDDVEVKVRDGYVADVFKDGLLIEVQTGNFSAIKNKLRQLVADYRVRLVYPIARRKWLVYVTEDGEVVRRRKSPKKGKLVDLFYELVHLPGLFRDRNFSFEVLFIEEEELRCNDGKGSWRKKGIRTKDRRLLTVIDKTTFKNKYDFLRFIPFKPDEIFTNKMLAKKLGVSVRLAQKITYCLRKMNGLTIAGKKRKHYLFKIFDV